LQPGEQVRQRRTVRKIKQLLEENVWLKRLVAELTLDKTMLQDVLAKKL
jgi:putative transposase